MSEQNQIARVRWLYVPLGKTVKVLHLRTPPFFPFATRAWQSQAAGKGPRAGLPGRGPQGFPIHPAVVVLGMVQENLVWVGPSGLRGAVV